ncbi:phage antirepressor KilAC domain-containing protein [Mammaliicoccus sciuri]|uniref:phage antirepressor KilAC domain-containing protein n=1 Tax=Mammaliicoccus sciuri TaxID=1296 RepID=UPI0034DD9FA1
MSELKIFNFDSNEVRTVIVNEKPYFVGKDVAEVLGYTNTRDALNRHVDDEDKKNLTSRNTTLDNLPNRGLTAVNESGLYSLIFSSKLESAKRFKRWVTSEVLPAIRKHGIYVTDSVIEQTMQDPDYIITVLTEFKKERESRLIAEQQVQELKPKATYYDLILESKSLLSVTEIAKDYGYGAKKFNQLLHELGIQYNLGKVWHLYAKYQDKGYTRSSTYIINEDESRTTTKWTHKGRKFLYEKLRENNIYPISER